VPDAKFVDWRASRSIGPISKQGYASLDAFWWSGDCGVCSARASSREVIPGSLQLLPANRSSRCVALANKWRACWALLAKGGTYRRLSLLAAV